MANNENSDPEPDRLSPTEFAILGLVAETPQSGYDIKKEVEGRLGHFWSESYGQIYPMLRRLHGRKLVAKRTERRPSRPDRHVYQITASGRRALRDWFDEPPVAAMRTRNEFLMRLFLGRHAPREHLLRDISKFREDIGRELTNLEAARDRIESEAATHPDRLYWSLVLDYGLLVFEALETWGQIAEKRLHADGTDSVGTGNIAESDKDTSEL